MNAGCSIALGLWLLFTQPATEAQVAQANYDLATAYVAGLEKQLEPFGFIRSYSCEGSSSVAAGGLCGQRLLEYWREARSRQAIWEAAAKVYHDENRCGEWIDGEWRSDLHAQRYAWTQRLHRMAPGGVLPDPVPLEQIGRQ